MSLDKVFVADLKTATLLTTWAPESGNVVHLATEKDVNDKLTAEQALRLYNGSVTKEEHLDMNLGETIVKSKLFTLLSANKDARVARPAPKPERAAKPERQPAKAKTAKVKPPKKEGARRAYSSDETVLKRTAKKVTEQAPVAPQAAAILALLEKHGGNLTRGKLKELITKTVKSKQPSERLLAFYQPMLLDQGFIIKS